MNATLEKKSLLQKYGIPIDRLDFEYIKITTNVKELERIVKILKSGEEGYFPDLTNCAEERLRILCPSNRLLRTEEPLRTKDGIDRYEWNSINNEILNWETDMKKCREKIQIDVKSNGTQNENALYSDCPIRQQREIEAFNSKSTDAKQTRIESTDYGKWDKYDADAETLKIDLDEERTRELNELKNKRNSQKLKLIEEIQVKTELTQTEKEFFSNRHREKGNEFFKNKEFDEAIKEYSKSIQILPTIAGFNNRAMTYLKLNMNAKAIKDCDECLKLDPCNIKALLRKGQGLCVQNEKRDAFVVYHKILGLDGENKVALNKVEELKQDITLLPPENALRMKIEEIGDVDDDSTKIKETKGLSGHEKDEENVEELTRPADFAKLIIPNKILPNKLPVAIKELSKIKKEHKTKAKKKINQKMAEMNKDIDILSRRKECDSTKLTAFIEEI